MTGAPQRGGARRLAAAGLATGLAALAISGCGGAGRPSSLAAARTPAPARSRIREERPPRPRGPYDVASPALERRLAAAAARRRPKPKPDPEPSGAPKRGGPMAPASAGTNGSFVPPPASQRKAIAPRTMAGVERRPVGESAIRLGGIALAPPDAPEAIKAAITAANSIASRPYVWGGGHASWYSRGYDCSGAVSYALGGGGFLSAPLDSTQLESFGRPGPGRWLTVYANAGHAYAVIAGLRWDTVGDARGSGPRWHPALPYPQGFVARHPAGY